MSFWARSLPGAAALAAAAWQMAWAQVPAAPAKSGLPLTSLDGNSQLGSLKSSPIADTKGDTVATDKVKIEQPARPPVDPKVLR